MRYHVGAAFKSPRSIRLVHELGDLKTLKKDSTIFDFEAFGDPPEKFIVHFNGRTLVPAGGTNKFPSQDVDVERTRIGDHQEAEIVLGAEYPRRGPQVRWLTPILHPNIWGGGTVCLGNYGSAWTPYFKLVDMIEILWDMARLAVLNPRSAGTGAYNAEKEWERLYREFKFPIDRRPLRDKILGNDEGSSQIRPGGAADDIVIMPDDGDSCPRES